jgi:kynureninase
MTAQAATPNGAFSLDEVRALDARDPLAARRSDYILPEGVIYLDGNSLGPAPKSALVALDAAARQEWAQGLIRSWNDADWFTAPRRIGDKIGALIGAAAGQTIVGDTTSLNVFKAVFAGLSLRPGRTVIVSEGGSFPTDLYMLEGVAQARPGLTIRLEGREAETIESLIDESVAVVLINQVDYRTGRRRDVAALTRLAHAKGAVIVWDLCHSAGAMEVGLDAAQVDLAVGCSYKYLNGGPGAPAFVYAAKRHHAALSQPLSGWWGHAAPFAFSLDYRPSPGIEKMQCGTQAMLSLRALEGAMQAWEGVDIAALRQKSLSLTSLFIALVDARIARFGVEVAAPREDHLRGSQVSLRCPQAFAVVQALIERGVIGDFRAPDFMRFGFAPLYLSHEDVWRAVAIMEEIFEKETWREERFQRRGAVT